MDAVTLSSVKPGRNPAWVLLSFSNDEGIAIPADQFVSLGIGSGSEVSEAVLADLREQSMNARTLNSALRLLEVRRRSRSELRSRLARKGYEAPAIEAALAWVTERGYLCDMNFARARAHDRLLGRAMGRRGLVHDLRSRGVDTDLAEAAADEAIAAHPGGELELARSAADKWLRTHGRRHTDPQRKRQALRTALARRGFSLNTIREAT